MEASTRQQIASERITRLMAHLLQWLGKHWLLVANGALALYAGLPVLAPWLAYRGSSRASNLLYLIYRPLCHQLPERSFFLFGPQLSYTLEELQALTGGVVAQRAIGGVEIGYKMAICERCVAIYGGMFLLGLLFALVRKRVRPIGVKTFVAFCVPMAIDGFGQLFGLWESSVISRLTTGGAFALACILLVYPYLEEGMAEVRLEARATLARYQSERADGS
ncbi:MAG: DUF2085 domain-containing protein [Anaerolineae bacterium]